MKKNILIALILIASLGAAPIAMAAQLNQKPQQEKQLSKAELRKKKKAEETARQIFVIDSILNARSYTFVAERVISGQADRTLTSRSTFIVDGKDVHSQLPYSGTTSVASYSTSQSPLEFDATDIKYQSSLLDKKDGKAFVLINAKNGTNSYIIGIEIFNNGSSAMSVQMSGGAGQTYYGYIEPSAKKPTK